MTLAPELDRPVRAWRASDLGGLPIDNWRAEIIDGALTLSPSPTGIHQTLALLLGAALHATRPTNLIVTQAVEVWISKDRSLIPDLLVVDAAAWAHDACSFDPEEVKLAVEIVSPSSKSMDRIMKPVLYAEAGIPLYWRVEAESLDEVSVHTYALSGSETGYSPTGSFSEVIEVNEPWQIRIPIEDLVPRVGRRES